MKWIVVMTYLNGGLVLICLGQMAHVNQCRPHVEKTFFTGGGVGIAVAALITFALALMASVELVKKRKRACGADVQASEH
jgi:hypothetical protein